MKNVFAKMTIALISAACLFCSSLVHAKTDRWYRVEVIVFETGNKQAEDWPTNPGKPSLSNAVNLVADANAPFGMIDDNQLTLVSAKKKIQKNYRLVMHKGWRQMIGDKQSAQKIHLVGGKKMSGSQSVDNDALDASEDPNMTSGTYEVDGTIRLTSGHYLHVDTDLLLGKRFRIKESTRVRLDEIQYIDHPLYGVIIMVTPEKSAG